MSRLTTAQAAKLVGVSEKAFQTWAARRGLERVDQIRLGRATINLWDADAVLAATSVDPKPWRKQ